ncbi:hypothetical protein C8Q77DRAFT_821310 [Trametes polyzona]|nr:hypothetical protein C8Q77DRAFT_821310 [Trametes polyzona]
MPAAVRRFGLYGSKHDLSLMLTFVAWFARCTDAQYTGGARSDVWRVSDNPLCTTNGLPYVRRRYAITTENPYILSLPRATAVVAHSFARPSAVVQIALLSPITGRKHHSDRHADKRVQTQAQVLSLRRLHCPRLVHL